jgi:hypothetical protein
VARVDDIAPVDLPADASGPLCINCYSIEVQSLAAVDGVKFKLDPAGLIYSLQWLHNGTPPDLAGASRAVDQRGQPDTALRAAEACATRD